MSSQLKKLKSFLRKCSKRIDRMLIKVFGDNKFFSVIYYLISSKFRFEPHAVLSGRKKHLASVDGSFFTMIRNTHRLEKGLSMKERRAVFAEDYILETTQAYKNVVSDAEFALRHQVTWARDVLEQYFKLVSVTPITRQADAIFRNCSVQAEETNSVQTKTPYPRSESIFAKVTYDDFYNLVRQRRSVRWYQDKPVPRELIDQAILAAAFSPSACNRQPFEFRIFDQPDLVNKVIHVPSGTVGWGVSPPVVVAMVGHLSAYFSEQDRHVIYIDSGLAVMSFMFALETLGLSSCAINFPDVRRNHKKISKLLALQDDEVVVMLVALGYSDQTGYIPYSAKREINLIRSYNRT